MSKKRIHAFEDQTVTAFSLDGVDIRLGIKCWHESTDLISYASVIFSGVTNLKITGDLQPAVGMLGDDGEIIHFELDDCRMLLIIVWRDYKKKPDDKKRGPPIATNVYTFDFGTVQILKGEYRVTCLDARASISTPTASAAPSPKNARRNGIKSAARAS